MMQTVRFNELAWEKGLRRGEDILRRIRRRRTHAVVILFRFKPFIQFMLLLLALNFSLNLPGDTW